MDNENDTKSTENDLDENKEIRQGEKSDGTDDVASDVLAEKPPVSEHVIEDAKGIEGFETDSGVKVGAPMEERENVQGPVKGKTDKYGLCYTEGIHKTENGKPVIGKTTGYLVIIPGVNHPLKDKTQPTPKKPPLSIPGHDGPQIDAQPGVTVAPPVDPNMGAKDAAKAATGVTVSIAYALFEEDAKPEAGEIEHLEWSFERYFIDKDIQDFPPGVALTVAVGSYYAKRAMKPKGKKKVSFALYKVKKFFSGLFRRKKKEEKDEEKEAA